MLNVLCKMSRFTFSILLPTTIFSLEFDFKNNKFFQIKTLSFKVE